MAHELSAREQALRKLPLPYSLALPNRPGTSTGIVHVTVTGHRPGPDDAGIVNVTDRQFL